MRRIRCDSGLMGWRDRLQKVYTSFEEFESDASTYGLTDRLCFDSAEEAWDANPTIQGSVDPSDYRRKA